jgi:hypothetical protein
MNNREFIFNFLNRYYRVELKKFFDLILEKNVFGSEIVEHLIAVHSIDEEVCKVLFTEWALTNMTLEDFENNWVFKRPIPEIARYEPKRMNRFLITFPEHFNIPQWVVFETSRPNMTIKSKKILGFELFKKLVWSDMIITMRDPIGPSTSQSFMDLIHTNFYEKKQIHFLARQLQTFLALASQHEHLGHARLRHCDCCAHVRHLACEPAAQERIDCRPDLATRIRHCRMGGCIRRPQRSIDHRHRACGGTCGHGVDLGPSTFVSSLPAQHRPWRGFPLSGDA